MRETMMSKIKKTGMILLVAIMFSTVLQASSTFHVDASTKSNGALILVNSSKIRTAECIEGQYIFRAEYYKDTEKMSIMKLDYSQKKSVQ